MEIYKELSLPQFLYQGHESGNCQNELSTGKVWDKKGYVHLYYLKDFFPHNKSPLLGEVTYRPQAKILRVEQYG